MLILVAIWNVVTDVSLSRLSAVCRSALLFKTKHFINTNVKKPSAVNCILILNYDAYHFAFRLRFVQLFNSEHKMLACHDMKGYFKH